jgi:uncharacterized protein with ParB-like and HNH nuclease domain
MNIGRYTLRSFLTDHNLDQIIIPEIQRDYVWKETNVTKLLLSIKENSEKQNNISTALSDELISKLPLEIRDKMVRELEANKSYCNVGFIYAYFDLEFPGRLMLIDGQQRMTTLFLLILAVSIKEKKQDEFRRGYFKDKFLKVDYKVRECTHDFLVNFVDHLLNGNDFTLVLDQYWYFSEYNEDVTIQSIYNNYKVIREFIGLNPISLQYIEDYVEFYYFDTNKSKQGEELYIYMNSRGESVSSGESVKAGLLKGMSDEDKNLWGSKWEEWQCFFWKNSKGYRSADAGMEEFLKWVKIIEFLESSNGNNTDKGNTIKLIKESSKVTSDGLELERIEYYFKGLTNIYDNKEVSHFEDRWLWGEVSAGDYLRLIPTLIYASNYRNCEEEEIHRFSRFFYNISKFENLSKIPYQSVIEIIELVNRFCDKGFKDVVKLKDLSGQESYKNILTPEEVLKLSIYEKADIGLRNEIESAFWNCEDYKTFYGRISFLFNCLDSDLTIESFESNKLEEFNILFSNFQLIFGKITDQVRRALLTFGDYKVHDGRTASLNGDRFSFISEEWRFKSSFSNKARQDIYKSLLKEFCEIITQNPSLSKEEILDNILNEYLKIDAPDTWIYNFVKEPKILEYCRSKYVCFKSANLEDIFLLQGIYAKEDTWCSLKDFLLELDLVVD